MKKVYAMVAILFAVCLSFSAFAQDVSVADFASQVLAAIKNFGGLDWMGKVASVIMLLTASMKVSFLNQWVWSKLGALQAWFAPLLAAAYGIVSLGMNGGHITLANVLAYFSAGAGALVLHELLDTLKSAPWVGGIWLQIIDAIEGALGGPGDAVQSFNAKKALKAKKA